MKQGNLKSKAGTLLLVATIIITSFPAFCPEVHAAELSEPSRFATAKQLQAFNTDDSDGSSNSTKLCFGKDNQEWWIAGSQGEGSLTLFAASPLARQSFEDDYESDKPYSEDWGCHYPGEAPSEVYPNHYGASPLRTTLKELETSYFSTAEQNLMKNTTIYTKDTKKDSVYSTTDKLYLANSVSDQSEYITVGANASDDLNNGLRIDPAYWINSMYWECDGFWLRTPHMNKEYREVVLLADTDHVSNCMTEGNVTGLVPAFELNLSSVLFASAAKAASSDAVEVGTIADDAAMVLRLNDADKAIGTLKCNDAAGLISARKDENAEGAVSLVVQGDDGDKEWYYSVSAGEATSVTKKQIQDACNISAEIDFGKCKIWLETAVDNVAYARMAERQITITAGDQSVMWGNGIDQSAYAVSSGLIAGDRISEITLTPSVAELTDNGAITVSGVKIVNAEGEDVTGSYDIALASGSLKVIHNTNLAPDRIEASKTKTAYTEGESLNVDDLTVTAYYADGYSGAVTGFATNASDIDMSVVGDRILTVSYTENGDTKTADIAIKVSAAPHVHEFGTDWKSDSDDHWHECGCGEKSDSAAHTEDSGTMTKPATETETGIMAYKCSVCGYEMRTESIEKLPPSHTHSYGTEWKSDSNNHWHECDCGDMSDSAAHTEDGGSVTKAPTETEKGIRTYRCSVCGYVMRTEEIGVLPPSPGTGDGQPGDTKPEDTKPEDTKPGTTQPGNNNEEQEPEPDGGNPATDGTGEATPEPGAPFIQGEPAKDGWEKIKEETDKAGEGDTVTVDMNGSAVVPGDVMGNIRGRDITVVFGMENGIAWSVGGKDVAEGKIRDIDFSVRTDAGNIPAGLVSDLARGRQTIPFRLAHEGAFGFTAVLSVSLGKENAGRSASLYYYNESTGELEFVSAATAAPDGTASFAFTHASDYLVVIGGEEDTADGESGKTEDSTGKEEDRENGKTEDNTGKEEDREDGKTEDNTGKEEDREDGKMEDNTEKGKDDKTEDGKGKPEDGKTGDSTGKPEDSETGDDTQKADDNKNDGKTETEGNSENNGQNDKGSENILPDTGILWNRPFFFLIGIILFFAGLGMIFRCRKKKNI